MPFSSFSFLLCVRGVLKPRTSSPLPNRMPFSGFNFPLCVRGVLKPRAGRPGT